MDVLKKGACSSKSKTIKFDRLLKEAQFHGSSRLAVKKYRFIWCFILAMMFLASLSILAQTIQRFLLRPTLMVQKESHKQRAPFPSLSICPEVSYPDYKMDAFVEEINFPSGVNVSDFRKNLRQLAAFYSPDVAYNVEDLEMLQTVLAFNDLDVESIGKRLTPSCEEVVLRCRLMGKMTNCKELFEMTLTKFAFCCVFNGRSLKRSMFGHRETKLYGVHNITPRQEYYDNSAGPMSGLIVVVNTSQEQNNIDLTYKWVSIQGGQNYVETMANGTPLATGTELWLSYVWTTFSIDDDARKLKQNMRQCRLLTEVLDYFPIYEEWNCLVECEMAHTLRMCQCLRVAHPHPPGKHTCGAASLNCTKSAAVTLGSDLCTCPPTCDARVSYYQVQTHELDFSNHLDFFYDELDMKKVSVVRAFIMTKHLKGYARVVYFNDVDLFSQLGGIVNVFFGCSILTLVEIIQIIWHAIKNRYYSRREKIKQLPPVKLKSMSASNRKKKLKTIKWKSKK